MHSVQALLNKMDHRELVDLVGEVGEKNIVQVRVDRASYVGKRVTYLRKHREVLDAKAVITQAMLFEYDRLRALSGKVPLYVPEAIRRCGGELVSIRSNLRTNAGINYTSVQLGGAASATVAKWIAVTNNTNVANVLNTSANTTTSQICWGTATATDAAPSISRGEYTALGVARAAATYAHTTAVASYTQTLTDTASGACTSLQAAGMFDSASQGAGTLFFETLFTATTLANADQLTLTWTVNA
jgi:hypothetical protein